MHLDQALGYSLLLFFIYNYDVHYAANGLQTKSDELFSSLHKWKESQQGADD